VICRCRGRSDFTAPGPSRSPENPAGLMRAISVTAVGEYFFIEESPAVFLFLNKNATGVGVVRAQKRIFTGESTWG
jgi:hypothetical protein